MDCYLMGDDESSCYGHPLHLSWYPVSRLNALTSDDVVVVCECKNFLAN